jgi:hypothetical protein
VLVRSCTWEEEETTFVASGSSAKSCVPLIVYFVRYAKPSVILLVIRGNRETFID